MQKFMVTGAAGFLGYHLANTLSQRPDCEVFAVDCFIRGDLDDLYLRLSQRSNVRRLDVDLTDRAAVHALPEDVDVVYHLAALNGTQNFYDRPFDVLRCCTLPTFHLLEKYGPLRRLRRFVYAGTSEAYAATVTRFGWPVPTAEDVPLGIDDVFNPRWSYGASKLHGEVLTINACRHFGLPFSVIRYHNAYGPRMGDKHVIPDFLMRAQKGIYALYGYEDTRAFLYVDDAIEATIRVAESEATAGEVVNVGGEREIRIDDLGSMMMEVCGFKGTIALHPSPQGSVKRRAPDTTKLKRTTGFRETWSLADGIAATARFYLGSDFTGSGSLDRVRA
jgi:nucleoside-diphosphate-sugar epimerase